MVCTFVSHGDNDKWDPVPHGRCCQVGTYDRPPHFSVGRVKIPPESANALLHPWVRVMYRTPSWCNILRTGHSSAYAIVSLGVEGDLPPRELPIECALTLVSTFAINPFFQTEGGGYDLPLESKKTGNLSTLDRVLHIIGRSAHLEIIRVLFD